MRLWPDFSIATPREHLRRRIAAIALAAAAATLAAATAACTDASGNDDDAPLIFAAASLADVAAVIADAFRRDTGNHVRFTFGGSNHLASQIADAGAPADAAWFAGTTPIDRLVDSNIIANNSALPIAENAIVVVASSRATAPALQSLDALADAGRIAVPDPDTAPAGEYARALLQAANVWESLQDQIVPTLDARAAVAAAVAGTVELAIAYRTDAAAEDVRILLTPELPPDTAPPTYYAAPIGDSPAAIAFTDYLRSDAAQDILRQHGFDPTQ